MKPGGVIQRELALLNDQILRLHEHLQEVVLERFKGDWILRLMAERAY